MNEERSFLIQAKYGCDFELGAAATLEPLLMHPVTFHN